MSESPIDNRRRPADFARLLLAGSGAPPRLRARDQQADLAGEGLRRAILDRIAAIDPEPIDLEAALGAIVDEIGEPTGPARGVATLILDEWEAAERSPGCWAWLLSEALASSGLEGGRRRRRGRPA